MWTQTDAQWRHVHEGNVAWRRAHWRALHKVKDEETTTSIHYVPHNLTVLCPELYLLSHHEKPRPFVDPHQVHHRQLYVDTRLLKHPGQI